MPRKDHPYPYLEATGTIEMPPPDGVEQDGVLFLRPVKCEMAISHGRILVRTGRYNAREIGRVLTELPLSEAQFDQLLDALMAASEDTQTLSIGSQRPAVSL